MRRALIACFVLFVLALVGILAWYTIHTRQIGAELDQFVAETKERKMAPVMIAVTVPKETPADQMLYLSGSGPALGNWEAAGVPMQRKDDGKYVTTVELMTGVPYEFKVTRGTWGTVEKGPGGEELPNRQLVAAEKQTVDVNVATWVDGGKAIPGRVTLTGDIRLHKKFRSERLGNERTLIVCLPPGYDTGEQRYPVLYMNDGQNLFDEATSFAGIEWKVDETLQRLINEGKIEPVIVVGIYNTEQRTAEFTPKAVSLSGKGDLYGQFIVEEVKPYIDKLYRTQPDPQYTALAGSSLGGLIALYVVKAHPDIWGEVAVLSPWLRMEGKPVTSDLMNQTDWLKNKRIWIDMGGAGGKNYPGDNSIGDAQELAKALDAAGLQKGSDYQCVETPDLEHNEAAWSTRVGDLLMFLYGK